MNEETAMEHLALEREGAFKLNKDGGTKMNEESNMEHMTMERERLAAMERPMEFAPMMPGIRTGIMSRMGNSINSGRQKLEQWRDRPQIWDRIDQAVHDEAQRIKIASKFIPLYGPLGADVKQVPSDTIAPFQPNQPLEIIETDFTPMNEIWADFTLTQPQVMDADSQMAGVTLALRSTNILSQFFDLLVFQGNAAFNNPLFRNGRVFIRNQNVNITGLLSNQNIPRIPVQPSPGQPTWGEETFNAVAQGYSDLQSIGHYGPYALVLHTVPYADTYRSLPTTLIYPALRIKPLVTAGFYGTGTLPPNTGVLVSLGGNTMDLAVGIDPTTEFVQEEALGGGRFRYRVYERFALRLKDDTGVVVLDFQ